MWNVWNMICAEAIRRKKRTNFLQAGALHVDSVDKFHVVELQA